MGQVIDLVGLLMLTNRGGAAPAPRVPSARRGPFSADEVDAHRSLSCEAYDRCLDEVLAAGWSGWTCERCPRFRSRRALRVATLAVLATARPGAEYPVD